MRPYANTEDRRDPAEPDLASRCNLADLPSVSALPLLGAVPAGAGTLPPAAFRTAAPGWLGAPLHGTWSAPGGRAKKPVSSTALGVGSAAGTARRWRARHR